MDKRAPILLVDDDATLLKLYSKLLSRFNEPVIALTDGLEAMKLVWQHVPALILLDVVMPEIDGFELCRQIRKAVPYPVPILFMTADDSLATAVSGLEAGGDDFMIKGIAVSDYLWRVNFWLRTPLPGLTASQRARALKHAHALMGTMKVSDPLISNEFKVDEMVQAGFVELARRAMTHAGDAYGGLKCQQHALYSYLLGAVDCWCASSLALMARAPAYVQAAIDAVQPEGRSEARDFFRKLCLIEHTEQHRRAFAAGQADARIFLERGNGTVLEGLAGVGA